MAAVELPELMDVDALYVSAGGVKRIIAFYGGQKCTRMQGPASRRA
jgi:hypothetical protein